MSRHERIAAALTAAFAPQSLEIVDESAKHAGHAARNGLTPNAETHFHVTMVAPKFSGQSRVARGRAVNDVLAAEFATGLHAMGLTLRSPEEADAAAAG